MVCASKIYSSTYVSLYSLFSYKNVRANAEEADSRRQSGVICIPTIVTVGLSRRHGGGGGSRVRYGCHCRAIQIAYVSYIRSVFDYGAAIIFDHACPAAREKLKFEQRKCARVIIGCIKLTEETSAAEAKLTPLTVRAMELAAREYGRLIRLSPRDPARDLLLRQPRHRLRYWAHEV